LISNRLATAMKKLANGNMDLPDDLYGMMKTLSDFNNTHIYFYYSYLVANPHIGRAFYNLLLMLRWIGWWSSSLRSSQKTNICVLISMNDFCLF
jgi:hypothetical protein